MWKSLKYQVLARNPIRVPMWQAARKHGRRLHRLRFAGEVECLNAVVADLGLCAGTPEENRTTLSSRHSWPSQSMRQCYNETRRKLPAEKRRSLTLDNGREFARPIELERRLDLPIYFAHPYHSWERGTNENTNGLLRQYLPKGSDLTLVTSQQLRSHVRQINHRPRKRLDFQTPFEVFHAQPSG